MSEALFHRTVAVYLEACLHPHVFWTTFPAGGGGRIRGRFLKGMGLKPGVPDVLIIHCGRALWLELKAGKGRVSEDQIMCHTALRTASSEVAVARSLEEVEAALFGWNVPLRHRLAA